MSFWHKIYWYCSTKSIITLLVAHTETEIRKKYWKYTSSWPLSSRSCCIPAQHCSLWFVTPAVGWHGIYACQHTCTCTCIILYTCVCYTDVHRTHYFIITTHQLYSTNSFRWLHNSWITAHLFLPDLEAIDVDIVLDVLERSSEAIHPLGQRFQLGL